MLYILLSVLFSSSLFLLFRVFARKGVHTFQAIVWNYLVATLLGLWQNGGFSVSLFQTGWFPHAVFTGCLFILMFYLIAFASQRIGPSAASVANKMSVVLPVLFAVVLYKDSLTLLKTSGLVLAIVGVYLAGRKEQSQMSVKPIQAFWIILVLFVGNGFMDAYLNYVEKRMLPEMHTQAFATVIFVSAFLLGVSVFLYRLVRREYTLELRSMPYGVLLGVFNYGSIFFLLSSLKLPGMESSVVFPLNNVGVVVCTSLLSYFWLKEPLHVRNKLGIACAVLAILFIAFS